MSYPNAFWKIQNNFKGWLLKIIKYGEKYVLISTIYKVTTIILLKH